METVPLNTTTIYIMKLEDDCWYIGKTNDIAKRVKQHFAQNGSTWTKLHKPIAMEACYRNASPFDEDKYTKEYMMKYGIDKVRGGTYSAPRISHEQKQLIQRELWGAQDLCFLCGKSHFVKDCPIHTTKINIPKDDDDTDSLVGSEDDTDNRRELNRKALECLKTLCVCVYRSITSMVTSIPPRHPAPS